MKYLRIILLSILLSFGLSPLLTHAATVTVGDREWFQVSDFRNISYRSTDGLHGIATLFDPSNGAQLAANPIINGVSLEGAIWASQSDVFELFNAFGAGLTEASPDKSDYVFPGPLGEGGGLPPNSNWMQGFFSQFNPTKIDGSFILLDGWTRTQNGSSLLAHFGQIRMDKDHDTGHHALTTSSAVTNLASPGRGAFFYKPVVTTPIPSSFLLMGSGISGLLLCRKKLFKKA